MTLDRSLGDIIGDEEREDDGDGDWDKHIQL
jgi:hypothetical protein